MKSTPPPFLLASASPRRRELLEAAGYRFQVRASGVEEPDPGCFTTPESYAVQAAWLKANDPAFKEDRWILGADTIAWHGSAILGKPADRDDARRILQRLQGTRHQVVTGVCLRLPKSGLSLTCAVSTDVRMKPLSERELEEYLDTGLWAGKAGAYGIQDHDDPFVEAVEGSYSNVMGLPMERLELLFEQAARIEPPSPPTR
jgi:septum formation protein